MVKKTSISSKKGNKQAQFSKKSTPKGKKSTLQSSKMLDEHENSGFTSQLSEQSPEQIFELPKLEPNFKPNIQSKKFYKTGIQNLNISKAVPAFNKIFGSIIINQKLEFIFADQLAKQLLEFSLKSFQFKSLIQMVIVQQRQSFIRSINQCLDQKKKEFEFLIYSLATMRKSYRARFANKPDNKDFFFRHMKSLALSILPTEINFCQYQKNKCEQVYFNQAYLKQKTLVRCFVVKIRQGNRIPNLSEFNFLNDENLQRYNRKDFQRKIRNRILTQPVVVAAQKNVGKDCSQKDTLNQKKFQQKQKLNRKIKRKNIKQKTKKKVAQVSQKKSRKVRFSKNLQQIYYDKQMHEEMINTTIYYQHQNFMSQNQWLDNHYREQSEQTLMEQQTEPYSQKMVSQQEQYKQNIKNNRFQFQSIFLDDYFPCVQPSLHYKDYQNKKNIGRTRNQLEEEQSQVIQRQIQKYFCR